MIFSPLQTMLKTIRIGFLIVNFLAAWAYCFPGCRQCTGTLNIVFTDYVDENLATAFFRSQFGDCATGGQYDIKKVDRSDCQPSCVHAKGYPPVCHGDPGSCKLFTFTLKVWRYCGEKKSIALDKESHCFLGVCSLKNSLRLTCGMDVRCATFCQCSNCGC